MGQQHQSQESDSKKLNRLIKKAADSVLGTALEPLKLVVERGMLPKKVRYFFIMTTENK